MFDAATRLECIQCARIGSLRIFNAAVGMPWVGLILCQHIRQHCVYCFQLDGKRRNFELPKGGAELARPRRSTGSIDSSPFATARAEMWEEAGIWVGWRHWTMFKCLNSRGVVLQQGLDRNTNGWIYTRLGDNDIAIDPYPARSWMTLDQYCSLDSYRPDHARVLAQVEADLHGH